MPEHVDVDRVQKRVLRIIFQFVTMKRHFADAPSLVFQKEGCASVRSTKDVKSLSDSSGTHLPLSPKSVASIAHEQNIVCSKTRICRQLFAVHAVGSRSMKKKEKYIE